ncbi:uncharacterized protein DUF397 [Saccharothrix carnea]|uniref:Uncharacterized protein DUF397 n=1 Tax=Saccharothrix carnea TaxID=1280637 RepID=A0A2P8IAF9_SACCR|nr:DUF397 domain-containing protein [Saccharothrix carnea]PSL55437.1 uncharacterized protein DUF397 [Saccharothrix carnea]
MAVSTVDLSGAVWRKSSRSGGAGNTNCVEVAFTESAVAVRDSKNPGAATPAFPAVQWSFFLRHLGS